MTDVGTVADFFGGMTPQEAAEGSVPRDQWDRPLIICPPGMHDDLKRNKDGLVAYHRASSFGKLLEDTTNLVKWQKRQVLMGGARGGHDLNRRILAVGDPEEVRGQPQERGRKEALNRLVEEAEELAGSNLKSAMGTAIHGATELIDLGESLAGLHPVLRERAQAYHRFCREQGIVVTSVEQFGVEDVHRVAGTWDRTGWQRGTHKIVDVKTSTSMAFAGITFAVQLAEYSRMAAYDPKTGERTPHDPPVDLERGVIIHVDRNEGGPVELYDVDLTVGWEWARLVDMVKAAQKAGKASITPAEELDPIELAIVGCTTRDGLGVVYGTTAGATRWTDRHRELAQRRWEELG